ncbi:MAG: GlsB/YeaQ/YmgE family stress response membrane protein [Ktedonobacterales bacterium]|nr:GlsB/YeaQ/YmgE family stress response membrane protein [Ktedonobacterales bacterium]
MGIVAMLIIGGLAGWLASVMVEGGGLGVLGDIIVGIVGAFLGSLIFGFFGGVGLTGFNLYSFIVALVGAVVLLVIVRLFTGNRATTRP